MAEPALHDGLVPPAAQHVTLKVPQYYEEDPTLWFEILEVNFELARITTERTKYLHARAALPYETARCLPKGLPTTYESS